MTTPDQLREKIRARETPHVDGVLKILLDELDAKWHENTVEVWVVPNTVGSARVAYAVKRALQCKGWSVDVELIDDQRDGASWKFTISEAPSTYRDPRD